MFYQAIKPWGISLASRPIPCYTYCITACFILPVILLSFILSQIVKSPETEQLTFEASLFLSLLANFHRSDAAKLNPYLQAIKETEDRDFIRALVRSTNYAMDTVIKYTSRLDLRGGGMDDLTHLLEHTRRYRTIRLQLLQRQ